MRKLSKLPGVDNLYVIAKYVYIYLSKFLCDDFTPHVITSLCFKYILRDQPFSYTEKWKREGGEQN